METKNNVLVKALITLILGFAVGYAFGGSTQSRAATKDASDQVSMHGTMSGMMNGLAGKTGDALDKAFLDEMIIHHEGAIEMAQTLLAGTKRTELKKLGTDIVGAQSGEIEMMKKWRTEWFPNQ